MIRGLRLTDVALQLLPGRLPGEDLATTHDEIARAKHHLRPIELARWSVAPSRNERHFVVTRDGRLDALSVLRLRHGPRAWEVAHLFARRGVDEAVADLLERAVAYVASRRGERLFLRVAHRSPIQQIAETAGFRVVVAEEVYTLARPMAGDLHTPGMDVRPPAIGLTFDQWQDSLESGSGVREYVWEHQGSIRGWVRLDQRGLSVAVDALIHPDEGNQAAAFVSYVAQLAWGHRSPTWIVPAQQAALVEALESRGWQHSRAYVVLARTVATPIREVAFGAVRA